MVVVALTLQGTLVGYLRLHLDKLDPELGVLALTLAEQPPIELHLNLLYLRRDQMRWHISQMLLYLLDLCHREACLIWLIVHLDLVALKAPHK